MVSAPFLLTAITRNRPAMDEPLKPRTPSSNLLGFSHLSQVFGMLFFNFLWITVCFVLVERNSKSWFNKPLNMDVLNMELSNIWPRATGPEAQILGEKLLGGADNILGEELIASSYMLILLDSAERPGNWQGSSNN
jgi:hypothetical protein